MTPGRCFFAMLLCLEMAATPAGQNDTMPGRNLPSLRGQDSYDPLASLVSDFITAARSRSLAENASAERALGIWGSCARYGCGAKFSRWNGCQCNVECGAHGNCCTDYGGLCGRPPAPSCSSYGCGMVYNPWNKCQCYSLCSTFGNCCADYEHTCQGATPTPAPAPETPRAAPLAPPRQWRPDQLSQPPASALDYRGAAWPEMTVHGRKEMHIFAIGDWGGMDGSLITPWGRPRIIAYKGGHTAGPHVFPRTRYNLLHTKLLCSHDEFVECFDTGGRVCPASCGFVMGVDTEPQHLVAAAFKARAARVDPQYILNVGDNFYWGGIEEDCGSPMHTLTPTARHQFDQVFEGIYHGPGLDGKPWLSVLGNHDWGGRVFNNGWDQQIAYTWASNRWIMPAPYWSQHVSYPDLDFSVDVFMIDSNAMDAKGPDEDPEHNICGAKHNPPGASCSAAGGPASLGSCVDFFWNLWREQQAWLEQHLAASHAEWQVVVTHFPCGHEAGWYRKLHRQFGLDLLVTGHRHDQELWHRSVLLGGLTCVVSGGGGGITSEASPGPDHSQWYGEAQYGFYDFTIAKESLRIESVNYDGQVIKTAVIQPK